MGILNLLKRPSAPNSAAVGDGANRCPECKHHREGRPADERLNRRRLQQGKSLEAPACSTFHETNWDEEFCPCQHASHSEHLVTHGRLAS